MKLILAVIIAAILVAAGGWYLMKLPAPGADTAPPAQEASSATQAPFSPEYSPGNLLLGTDASTALGTYLIASNGFTLYTYTRDKEGVSSCSGLCAQNWPPYTVASKAVLKNIQKGVGGTVDAISRTDGDMQVTYNGAPLYFWSKDKKSGDTTGQGVGGVWFVAKP